MSGNSSNVIFVGPSAQGCGDLHSLLGDSFQILPPVKRGDVSTVTRTLPPATLVIVDGLFHGSLAVGHAEIMDALRSGWNVWGLSSMGAIRACEMRDFGMKGFGQVYKLFITEEDFQDDEVALLHGSLPPYPAITEPLVHLRVAIEELQRHQFLSLSKARKVRDQLKCLWYGKRTLTLFKSLILPLVSAKKRADAAQFLSPFSRFRIKTLDLQQFLQEQPWQEDSATSRLP
jgi:hypothetical protein